MRNDFKRYSQKDKIKIATWNYGVDLQVIQETKQTRSGFTEVEEYIFFSSGGQDKVLLTGFM